MLKKILLVTTLLASSSALADYCVTWIAPTQNTDDSPLTDLAGFKLWCSPFAIDYGQPVVINDPTSVRYKEINPSSEGPWKCRMTAFNESGIESTYSEELIFTLLDQNGDGNPEVVGTNGSCTFQPGAVEARPPTNFEVN